MVDLRDDNAPTIGEVIGLPHIMEQLLDANSPFWKEQREKTDKFLTTEPAEKAAEQFEKDVLEAVLELFFGKRKPHGRRKRNH
jgi:hypothetical protein